MYVNGHMCIHVLCKMPLYSRIFEDYSFAIASCLNKPCCVHATPIPIVIIIVIAIVIVFNS